MQMREMRSLVVCLFAACLIAEGLLLAQLPTATILGSVKDSSGAVVPNATLTARNVDTGLTRKTVSANDGSYRFSALPVGNYQVRVEHSGFQSTLRSGLTLTVGQQAVVNFTLAVGQVEQTVQVTAQAPLVNTTSGALGSLVNQQKVAELPLNGRNYIDLAFLQPGIEQHVNHGTAAVERGQWFSANGAPLRSNSFLLDGAMTSDIFGTTASSVSGSTLGVDGIREFRVITNSFPAEYGMTMGSQVVLVSKSGTNQFHGSAFEYLRNSALDARNFFDYRTVSTPSRLPPFKRNQYGGSFGGPIKKDKTFFFGTYEALKERLGVTELSNTMPAGCHGGANATITNSACPLLGSVPSVTVSPTAAPLLDLYPVPNLPGNQFTYSFSQPTNENYGQMRVDQNFSNNDNMFGRYTVDDTNVTKPFNFPPFVDLLNSRSQFLTLSENHIFSPTLLNTARFSFSRTNVAWDSPAPYTGPQYSFVQGQEIGTINVGGITGMGGDLTAPSANVQNIFAYSDDLSYVHGRHSLKFGVLINHFQQYILTGTFSRGRLTFPNVAGLLQAEPTVVQAATPGSILDRLFHLNTFGFYGQDDFRVNDRLTLNIGLRYEFATVPNEVNGHGSAVRDLQHDTAATLGAPWLNPSLTNFSPRFGFAWDVMGDGKTAVRGGFAELYDVAEWGGAYLIGVTGTPPFSSQSSVSHPGPITLPLTFTPDQIGKTLRTWDYHMAQPHILQFNLTVERQLPANMALTLSYVGSRGLNLAQVTDGNPTIPQILPGNTPFWTGNDPRTNPAWSQAELHTAGGASWYNALQFMLNKRLSRGLQFQSSYTWSKLLDDTQGQFGGENNASATYPMYPQNPFLDWAPSQFDITQNWKFNALYHFPKLQSGGVVGTLLNGWWTSGILSLQTGYPFSVVLHANRSRSGVLGGTAGLDRPNLVAGRNNSNITSGTTAGCYGVAAGQKLGTPNLYYDPCAFTIQPAGFLGTAGRDILRGPGLANLDFSLVKDTPLKALGEAGSLEFRAEFFNILNHANFITPGIGATGANNASVVYAGTSSQEAPLSTAGVLTSTVSASRQIQFALRLVF